MQLYHNSEIIRLLSAKSSMSKAGVNGTMFNRLSMSVRKKTITLRKQSGFSTLKKTVLN